jgi:hypothetical protein
LFLRDYCGYLTQLIWEAKDISKRPVGSPMVTGRAKRKHFSLAIRNTVEALMK